MRTAFMIAFSFSLLSEASAQVTPSETGAETEFPTTLRSGKPAKAATPQKAAKTKKYNSKATYDARKEFEQRVDKAARERARNQDSGEGLEEMKAPYFGHRKVPKVRPVEKRKLCKVCGIRH